MINRYNVWARPFALRHLADRLLRDAFASRLAGESAQQGSAMDPYEEGDNLVIKIPMPGVKPEDIEVTLAQGLLTVRGKTTTDAERTARSYIVREQRTGSFTRQIRVSERLDADAVQATFEHGVLRLMLPKDARALGHRIPITTGVPSAIEPAPAAPPDTSPAASPVGDGADKRSAAPAETVTAAEVPVETAAAAEAPTDTPTRRRSRPRKPSGDASPEGAATGRGPAARKPRARKTAPTPA